MKVFVTHDEHGSIKAIGLAPAQRTGIGVKPKAGHRVSVVELPEVEHAAHLTRFITGHRVDTHSGHPKLVKK